MPAIAKIEFLPDADGRVLIFVHHAPPDPALDTARGENTAMRASSARYFSRASMR
jgi:hypothetical protein